MKHNRKHILSIGRFDLPRFFALALAAFSTGSLSADQSVDDDLQPSSTSRRMPTTSSIAPIQLPSPSRSLPPAPPAVPTQLPSAPSAVTKQTPSEFHAVDIKANCSWKDENGYVGKMKLLVTQNVVREFSAAVNNPKHGHCNFSMTNFRQILEASNVELKGVDSSCTVRMWTQGRQVSVAFSSCESMCTGDLIDYLWPILADSTTGSCG